MKKNWTREETIIALDLYYKIPFSKTTKNNSKIIELAELLGRTPSSVAMKLGNFGSCDENLKSKNISGLTNASKLDKEIFNEFVDNLELLAFEKEKAIANIKNIPIEENLKIDLTKLSSDTEKLVQVKQRINQNFFRNSVLGLYNYKCCISGYNIPCLLEAAHIINWSKSKENRLNPENGICLNVLLHKAYDNYLISITPDYKVVINEEKLLFDKKQRNNVVYANFVSYKGKVISLPDKYKPNKDLLGLHYEMFRKQN